MSEPTTVNAQITDAVTQTNVKVVADNPATAMADLFTAKDNEAEGVEDQEQ